MYVFLGKLEENASDSMITSMILVCYQPAFVLFDLGSTYSYVSVYCTTYFGLPSKSLFVLIYVANLVRDSLLVDQIYILCLLTIKECDT